MPPHDGGPKTGPSTPVTVPAPSQLSVQDKSIIAGTSSTHSTVIFAGGGEKTGGVISFIVIVWVTFIELPQSSVTLYVRVITSGQEFPSEASETNATTTGQSLTMFVIEPISLTGNSDIH